MRQIKSGDSYVRCANGQVIVKGDLVDEDGVSIGGTPLGFTPEDVANKTTDIVGDYPSDDKYPSLTAIYDWVSGLLENVLGIFITNEADVGSGLNFFEGSNNGSDVLFLKSPDALPSNITVELPDATTTLVGDDTTQTLTNKRVNPRVGTVVSSATPSINTDNVDAYSITALATAITSFTTNLSGTPTDFQILIIRIKDDGTARAITWGASFEAKGVALPTTTTLGKVLTVGFIYSAVTSKWGCVSALTEA